VVSVNVSGYSLDATLKDMLAKMLREVKNRHDVILTGRKV
jgi:hypothetical protein